MIDFTSINHAALPHLPDLLQELLPEGRFQGREYVCGDVDGNPGRSLSVNLDSGKWADFATDQKGGDPVSLLAAIRGVSQGEAARALVDRLGNEFITGIESKRTTTKNETSDTWKSLIAEEPPAMIRHPKHGKPSASWEYRGPKGELLGIVCRFNHGPGKKEVIPFTYGTDTTSGEIGWKWKGWPAPRPLYGLDRLAQRLAAPVLLVEGEKTADAAQRLIPDAVCTTWPGGSSAVAKTDFGPLKGRRVAIWPDADEPGRKAADAVALEARKAGAEEVAIVEIPPGKGYGWDLANAEEEGWTAAQVAGWIKEHQRKVQATTTVTGPESLPDELLPVAAFDFALLPDSLRTWAEDVCERVQCPPDFVAAGIITSLAAVIGRKIGIRPQAQTDWTVTPNLWALVVGRPGVLKSPALEATLAPLKRLAAQANEEYATAYGAYKKNLTLAKLRSDAGEKAARKQIEKNPDADVSKLLTVAEPNAPVLRRYIANDTSPASLGELLRQNPNGLLVYRDELVSLLKGLDREDQAEGRGFYLTGWNGDSPYTFDRIGRGLNLHIEAVCLSVLGGTQPGRMAEYIRHAVKGGSADDGLIQRFGLLVWPDTGGKWKDVDRWPDNAAKKKAFEVFDHLSKLNPATIDAYQDKDLDGNPDGLPYLRFDSGGLELFQEWRTDLEVRLRSGDLHPALESHFAKYRKLIPALAIIIHLADGGIGPVSRKSTLKALAWGDYLETHARRAYGAISQPEVSTAKAILKRIKRGDLPTSFSSRDVWRPGWAMLSDRVQVLDALRLLVDYGWLREERIETAGRPATIYHFNGGSIHEIS